MALLNTFPRVLILISAGDMGVDQPTAQLVLDFEIPEDVSTTVQVQRMGQVSWDEQEALFVVDTSAASYITPSCCIENKCHS
jgi:hypothetical protein